MGCEVCSGATIIRAIVESVERQDTVTETLVGVI
jgi:hypothetical protein